MGDALIEQILMLLASLIVTGLSALAARWLNVQTSAHAMNLVGELAGRAYLRVAEKVAMTPSHVDDKAAMGLKYFSDEIQRRFGREPTSKELAEASAIHKAMHGREKLAQRLAIEGAPIIGSSVTGGSDPS
jgi:hypothetical protein